MNFSKPMIAASSALALALAACADDSVDETEIVAAETEAPEYDPMTRDYTFDEEGEARRAEFDEDALQSEYRTYRDEVVGERVTLAGSEDRTDAETAAAAQARDPATNMRARKNMTWSYLDRNGDGKLSVAEYAIWAIPLDPSQPKPNDETKPYLTSEQANKAADSFFYYDQDGDTYLSQQEFSAARRGDDLD